MPGANHAEIKCINDTRLTMSLQEFVPLARPPLSIRPLIPSFWRQAEERKPTADPVLARPVIIRLVKLTGSARGRDSVPAHQTTITKRHDRHVRRASLHDLQPRKNADQHPARQKPARRAQLRMSRLQGHLPPRRRARVVRSQRTCL